MWSGVVFHGADLDQLGGDADGDLGRGFSSDVKADGGGDAGQILVGESLVTEDGKYAGGFSGAADDPDVMGRGAQNLGLDDGVVFVAAGHDHDIVVLADGDEVGNAVIIDEHGVLCQGKAFFLAEVFPVL